SFFGGGAGFSQPAFPRAEGAGLRRPGVLVMPKASFQRAFPVVAGVWAGGSLPVGGARASTFALERRSGASGRGTGVAANWGSGGAVANTTSLKKISFQVLGLSDDKTSCGVAFREKSQCPPLHSLFLKHLCHQKPRRPRAGS